MTPTESASRFALHRLMALLQRLGPVRASNLGGAITRTFGPLLPTTHIAHANLRAALPGLTAESRQTIIRQVWDNLGRTIAEMPLLDRLGPVESGIGWIIDRDPAVANADFSRGAIYFAGHLANWEVMMAVSSFAHDNFAVLYRAAANEGVDEVIRTLRNRYGSPRMQHFRKGATGARQAIAHLRRGGVLGLLADQKANDGIAVPFFGRPAMTAPAVAALALKFRIPLIPSQAQRLGPAQFRVTLHAPLPLPETGDRHADIATLTATVNDCLESWIRQSPRRLAMAPPPLASGRVRHAWGSAPNPARDRGPGPMAWRCTSK